MRAWWADTLFKRLFLLMWFGLVASHLLAFTVVTRLQPAPPGAARPALERLPVLPSLPPVGGPAGPPGPRDAGVRGPDARGPDGRGAPEGPPPDAAAGGRPFAPPPDPELDAAGGLPAAALWLDYAVRFVAIGVVAWFGARWLSTPMRRLAEASDRLGHALGERHALPALDERRGTLEVRRTARVFNTMAARLRAQFDAQTLLMAAVSHDLRTPLSALRLLVEAVEDGVVSEPEDVTRSLARMRTHRQPRAKRR